MENTNKEAKECVKQVKTKTQKLYQMNYHY